ncbi:hypothetical protein U9M48_037290 [Paspalum notatum var. saurae]|uniref:Uncharacterized protein n=1 Tax=Paspalum notatum var. saurae TaxID=547442 RepID=A0AAQ3X948_PASNO
MSTPKYRCEERITATEAPKAFKFAADLQLLESFFSPNRAQALICTPKKKCLEIAGYTGVDGIWRVRSQVMLEKYGWNGNCFSM